VELSKYRKQGANDMTPLGTQVTRLIHELLGVVMTFAYSHGPLVEFRAKAAGGSKYLDRALFELPEERATRSAMELALLFRSLDHSQGISKRLSPDGWFGDVYDASGNRTDLSLREVTNKIIHAEEIKWDFTNPAAPLIVCHAQANQGGSIG
jgi:hypothetical protein